MVEPVLGRGSLRIVALAVVLVAIGISLTQPVSVAGEPERDWQYVADSPEPLARHFAVLLTNGNVLVVAANGAHAYVFDTATTTFKATGAFKSYRFSPATLVALPDGAALVTGVASSRTSGGQPVGFVFTAQTNEWSAPIPMAHLHTLGSAVSLPDGGAMILGGVSERSTEIWDPRTGAFTPGPDLASPRTEPGAIALADGRVVVIGGNPRDKRVEILDASRSEFRAGPEYKIDLSYSSSVVRLGDGRVLVADGAYPAILDPTTGRFTYQLDALMEDLLRGGMRPLCDIPSWSASVLLSDGRVLITGGLLRGGGSSITANSIILDPETFECTAAASMLTARYEHTATMLSDGSVLVIGGFTAWNSERRTTLVERYAAGRRVEAPPGPHIGPDEDEAFGSQMPVAALGSLAVAIAAACLAYQGVRRRPVEEAASSQNLPLPSLAAVSVDLPTSPRGRVLLVRRILSLLVIDVAVTTVFLAWMGAFASSNQQGARLTEVAGAYLVWGQIPVQISCAGLIAFWIDSQRRLTALLLGTLVSLLVFGASIAVFSGGLQASQPASTGVQIAVWTLVTVLQLLLNLTVWLPLVWLWRKVAGLPAGWRGAARTVLVAVAVTMTAWMMFWVILSTGCGLTGDCL